MKQFWVIVIVILVITSITVVGFTIFQANGQRASMAADLQYRTRVLAESLADSVGPVYVSNNTTAMQKILDKFTDKQGLVGIAIYDNSGNAIASSKGLSDKIVKNKISLDNVSENSSSGAFVFINGSKFYEFIKPLQNDDSVVGALMVVQKADYIDSAVMEIWTANLLRLFLQSLVFALALVFLLRWSVSTVMRSIKHIRSGRSEQGLDSLKKYFFFKPLATEISKVSDSLVQARSAASEEARLRLEKTDSPWTEDRLKEFVKAYLKDQKIFLVFNKEPYSHIKGKNGIYIFPQAGGVITALEPLMEACGGMWIAHGSGSADKETVDKDDKVMVPPEDPKYTLKRVWLSDKEFKGYNYGYSAEGLYPLCLNTYVRPFFREEDWVEYKRVNGKFARILLSETKDVQRPIIIVNEYHFTLLPQMIKKNRPDARVGIFWHTPWPSAEVFNVCPQRKQIIEGMLNADVIGFHTQQFCNNFIDTVGKNIEALIDLDKSSVTRNGHTCHIRSFPVGVVFSSDNKEENNDTPGKEILNRLKVKTKYLGLGVDRLDYVKGIPERFKAIEYFLDNHHEYIQQFTFVQIASPCRTGIKEYIQYKEVVSREAERINKKFGTKDWQPIVLEMVQYSHQDLKLLYGLANVCVVTSLQDGMNLVSKEFVAARNDEKGVLVLSQFTGASQDLSGALIINPHSTTEIAEAIYKAITMPLLEQRKRMKGMRKLVKNYNIYRWAAELLKAIADL